MPSGSATRSVTSSADVRQPEPVDKVVVAVDSEIEVLEERQQREIRADRDDQRGALPRHVSGRSGRAAGSGGDHCARPAERDHQPGDVVDERREQEQEREQRIRPAVEDEAHERQHQVLRAPRHGVIEQQRDRKEVEEEEKRAEDHPRKQGYWVGADKAGMPVRSGPARWLFCRIGIVLALILLGPKIAVAQTGDRFWGYTSPRPPSSSIPWQSRPASSRSV